MKYLVLIIALSINIGAFADKKETKCGKYENRQLYKGEKGGCYYKTRKNGKQEKVYIDKSKCNC